MPTETTLLNQEPREIEVRPITLLCHTGNMQIETPARREINPQHTLARAEQVTDEELETHWHEFLIPALWDVVWKGALRPDPEPEPHATYSYPRNRAELDRMNMGGKHVLGLLFLMVEATLQQQQFFLRTPEAFLYPRQQAHLADLVVLFANPDRITSYLREYVARRVEAERAPETPQPEA